MREVERDALLLQKVGDVLCAARGDFAAVMTWTEAGISVGVLPMREASTTTGGSSAVSVSFVSAAYAPSDMAANAAGSSLFIFLLSPSCEGT